MNWTRLLDLTRSVTRTSQPKPRQYKGFTITPNGRRRWYVRTPEGLPWHKTYATVADAQKDVDQARTRRTNKGSRTVHAGDCLTVLPTIPDQSVDAVITDPPYPEIRRSYGTLTECQWHKLMDRVVDETRRVLKPHGSAVFILQPNYNKVGSMRLWLWEFLVRTAKKWNLIQNVYWWNYTTPPLAGTDRKTGLLRGSVKYCLWFGAPDCYRNQNKILWEPANFNPAKLEDRALKYGPSGQSRRDGRMHGTAIERGGSTPFNMIPLSHESGATSSGFGHGAGTPIPLADWWTSYLTKPGDTILDPFNGAGTMGVSAVSQGRKYIGIEKNEQWVQVSRQRIAKCS